MKKIVLLFFATSMFVSSVWAQNADIILGKWLSEEGTAQIQVIKRGNKFFGKIIWLKSPNNAQGSPKLDVENPEVALKKRPIMGLEILRDLAYDSGEWSGGTIYDPETGKTYSSEMTLGEPNKLSIRGYIGISLIGRTSVWTRVQ